VIDQVTHRAATRSRARDNLVQDRADSLTQLFVDNEQECTEIVAMALAGGHSRPGEQATDATAYWDAFSRHLRQRPPS
jgi:cell envelope opacity-associated protein A